MIATSLLLGCFKQALEQVLFSNCPFFFVFEQKSSWSKQLSTGWFATVGHSNLPHFGTPSAIFGKRAQKVYSISLRIFT